MSKQNRVMVWCFSFLLLGLLQGCSPGNFYLKTVAAKDAKITSDIKIAVIPENWYWLGVSNFLPRALITEFMDLGFTVVERAQLEEVFQELKLNASGAVKDEEKKKSDKGLDFAVLDKTSIKKIGELLGVNALLVSYIVPSYNENVVNQATFRLVDVETAQVLFSVTFINSSTDGTKLLKAGGAVSTRQVIKAISLSIEKLLKGEKKLEGKMGTLDVTVNPIKR
ncbi:MAG: CsgG/HfaB family protein [Elusimicrobia bacterium]|nr:CsgG/HfaB family protein [Elusimicrobiota bacterium]